MFKKNHRHRTRFDTLRYANRLEAAGFTKEQAQVQAEAFLEVVDDQLATKANLEHLESNMNAHFAEVDSRLTTLDGKIEASTTSLRLELKSDMELLKRDMKIWFGVMLVVMVTVLPTIITFIMQTLR